MKRDKLNDAQAIDRDLRTVSSILATPRHANPNVADTICVSVNNCEVYVDRQGFLELVQKRYNELAKRLTDLGVEV